MGQRHGHDVEKWSMDGATTRRGEGIPAEGPVAGEKTRGLGSNSIKGIVVAALAPITASLRGDARPRSWRWTPWIQVAYLSCLLFTAHLATEARRVGRLAGAASSDYQDSSRAASAVALAGACLILTSFLAGVRPSSGPARVIWILEFALILAVPALMQ